jgi:hypothetical protein
MPVMTPFVGQPVGNLKQGILAESCCQFDCHHGYRGRVAPPLSILASTDTAPGTTLPSTEPGTDFRPLPRRVDGEHRPAIDSSLFRLMALRA